MLLEAGADINHQDKVRDHTKLIGKHIFYMYMGMCIDTCVCLKKSEHVHCVPPQWGQTAVFSASACGHSEVVKLLIQAGADLELQDKVHI